MNKQGLLDAIEAKRTELLQIAFEKGLTSPAAITLSQELDCLLNLYDERYIQSIKKLHAK